MALRQTYMCPRPRRTANLIVAPRELGVRKNVVTSSQSSWMPCLSKYRGLNNYQYHYGGFLIIINYSLIGPRNPILVNKATTYKPPKIGKEMARYPEKAIILHTFGVQV